MHLVTGDEIAAAAARIDGRAVRTPLLFCPRLSEELDLRVAVKAENLQHMGALRS